VVADKQQGEFDDEDRLLLATLAAQLNASMHNAIAYQREHMIAETFQQALLMAPPAIPGIEVGVHYRAATDSARVGGDFYDIVSLGPGRLMVIVGDVCGKSLGAAAQSAVVRYMLRAYAAEGSPGEALSRLNAAVIAQTPNQPFVTLVLAYVDVARHMFEYACAGHPRPVVRAGNGEFPMPGEGNVPVGIFRGVTYPTNRAVLPDDSCVVFYTDGITDARRDGVLFGEERLEEAVRANLPLDAQALADALLEAVKEYAGGVLADDCAVVTVKLP
jgi:serine phosphatase RsbU (regulator of sigma subunit)